MHSTSVGSTLCFHTKKALEVWGNCKLQSQMLQRYIVPPNRVPVKIRVYWKALEGPRYFLIESCSAFPEKRQFETRDGNYSIANKYQHNLSDFPYAGQLLKSSFNSFMPEKSKITKETRATTRNNLLRYQKSQYTSKVNKDLITSINEDQVSLGVKSMMEELVAIINHSIGKYDKKVATELLVDFIQGQNKVWYMYKCKGHQYDYLTTKTKISYFLKPIVKKSILNVEFARGFFESIKETANKVTQSHSLTINSFDERLTKIENKYSRVISSRLRIWNMDENVNSMVKNYMQNPPLFKIPARGKIDVSGSIVDSIIDSISKDYDERINTVRSYHQKSSSTQ